MGCDCHCDCDFHHFNWLKIAYIFAIISGALLILQIIGLFSGIFPALSDDYHERKIASSFVIVADLITAGFLIFGGLGSWRDDTGDKGLWIRMLLVGYGMLLYSCTIQMGWCISMHLIPNVIIICCVWAITLGILFFLRKIYIS